MAAIQSAPCSLHFPPSLVSMATLGSHLELVLVACLERTHDAVANGRVQRDRVRAAAAALNRDEHVSRRARVVVSPSGDTDCPEALCGERRDWNLGFKRRHSLETNKKRVVHGKYKKGWEFISEQK